MGDAAAKMLTIEELIKEVNRIGPVFVLEAHRSWTWKVIKFRRFLKATQFGYDITQDLVRFGCFSIIYKISRFYIPMAETYTTSSASTLTMGTFNA